MNRNWGTKNATYPTYFQWWHLKLEEHPGNIHKQIAETSLSTPVLSHAGAIEPLIDKAHPQVCPHGDARLFLQLKINSKILNFSTNCQKFPPQTQIYHYEVRLSHRCFQHNFPFHFQGDSHTPDQKGGTFWVAWLSRWGEKFLAVDLWCEKSNSTKNGACFIQKSSYFMDRKNPPNKVGRCPQTK